MPIYTYVCNDCGEKFDLLIIGRTAEKTKLECEKCHSKNIKKVFSTFSIGSSKGKSSSSESSCPTGTCPTSF
jgi:putative FmdB family regulatory protein